LLVLNMHLDSCSQSADEITVENPFHSQTDISSATIGNILLCLRPIAISPPLETMSKIGEEKRQNDLRLLGGEFLFFRKAEM